MYYSIEFIRLTSVILITFTHIRHQFNDGVMHLLLDQIPLYGTLILSVISGYLFSETTARKPALLRKKTRSLAIPYLIANTVVIIPVIIAYYFGYDYLNRLDIGMELIWNGLLSVSAAPVNPPTYFIRDLFVIFLLIETIRSRNIYSLGAIILLAITGDLLLRYDILFLFLIGASLSRYKQIYTQYFWISVSACLALGLTFSFLELTYARHIFTVLVFLLVINWSPNFMNIGGYSYTLHLYHSPVIVVLFPILNSYINNMYLLVLLQLTAVFIFVSLIYLLIRKLDLNMAIGGR